MLAKLTVFTHAFVGTTSVRANSRIRVVSSGVEATISRFLCLFFLCASVKALRMYSASAFISSSRLPAARLDLPHQSILCK